MEQTWKRIGSLLLSVCMVFTLLPTMAFAETDAKDSGMPLGMSRITTAFTELDMAVSTQSVEVGTTEDELNLPDTLAVTVTTILATTATVSGNDIATDNETPEPERQEIQEEAIVPVTGWTSNPEYNGEVAGNYVFNPTLDLPEGLTLSEGVSVPTITVAVQEAPASPAVRGAASNAFQVEGGGTYATLAEAAAVVPDGGTITMLKDVEITNGSIALNYPKSYTIDFGGYTLKQTRNASLLYITAGIVRLKNGTLRADAADTNVSNPNAYAVRIEGNSPSVIVESGTYYGYSAAITNQYTLVIVSGNFSNTADNRSCIYGSFNGTQLMEGSVASPPKSEWTAATKEITVTAGTATDTTPPTFSVVKVERTSNNRATIRFKTEEIIGFALYYLVNEKGTTAPTKEEVRDGALLGSISYGESNQYVTLSAGDKDVYIVGVDVAGNVSEPVKTEVKAITETFRVEGGDTYTTLEEAVQAVPNSGTITMLREVTVAKPSYFEYGIVLDAPKSYTIDFGGYMLRSGDNSRIRLYLMLIKQGAVVLKNGEIKANKDNGHNLMPSAVAGYGAETTVDIINMNISGSDNAISGLTGSTTTLWSGIFKSLLPPIPAMYEENGQIVLASGSTAAPTSSWKNAAAVTVTAAPVVNAAIPTITVQPVGANYTQGDTATPLSVEASVSDGGTLSYQWFSSSSEYGQRDEIPGETNSTYTPSTSEFDVGTTYYYCQVKNTKENLTPSAIFSNAAGITVSAPSGNTATLNIRMDNSPFTSQMGTYTLKLDGSETTTVIMTGTGSTRTADIGNGIWKIYDASNNYTGVNITVNNAPAEATLDYYTVNYSVIKQGTTSDGRINLSAVSLGGNSFEDIASGSSFLNGDKAIFTAAGTGAESYTYAWSGTHGGETISGTDSIYRINSVQGKVDITCTITGNGTVSVPVPGNSGTITVADITQNSLTLNWANAASTVQGSLKYAVFQSTSANISTTSECTSHQELLLNANPSDINTCAVSGLSPNTTYYFNVVVIDDKMGMAAYTMVSATTTGGGTTPTITVTKHPQSVTVTQGSISGVLTAEAVASNGATVKYQWRQFIGGIGSDNTQPMLGETSNTFAIPTGLPAGTYQYLCVFNTDGTDYVDSNTAIVTVKPPSGGSTGGDSGNTGGSGGSGGSSGGGSEGTVAEQPTIVNPNSEKPNSPTTTTTDVKADSKGNATVTDSVLNAAVKKAQDEAKKNGTEQNGIAVEFNITGMAAGSNMKVNLPKSVLDKLASDGVRTVTLKQNGMELTLDLAAVKEIQKANSDVTLSVAKQDVKKLSEEAQKAIGNRPVYSITLKTKDGKAITDFGNGQLSFGIPYTLAAGEKAGNLFGVFVDVNGKVEWLTNSSYDAVNKMLLLGTGHLSVYGVGYKADTADTKFSDIDKHWAKNDIEFVAARGLFYGIGNGKFAPDQSMTRGMFVTAIGRMAQADVSKYTTSKFTDVKAGSYYLGYVEWAAANGIVKGTSDTTFAPDKDISRQEMATIMASYAKAIGFALPKVYTEVTFADSANIGTWAKDSVKAMQMAGVFMGKDGNKFDPQGTATRAEVSALLHRFIELAISTDTVEGWVMNDSGK